ncbi:phage holin family protein [Novosphingopyxis sp.]|uniref:phage holin family protein n=1 Tax=Novosphingopyxis sp. TaxID=2709690 RepID=UPI003B5A60A8
MDAYSTSEKHRVRLATEQLPPPVGETLHENIDRLVADIKELVATERDYWRARMRYSKSLAKQSALLFGASIALAASAFTALILGTLLVLSARIGPIAATISVTLVTLAISAALAWLALKRARKLTFATPDPFEHAEDNSL